MVLDACIRFTVAALAFSPFLKKALTSKLIRRGGLELGFWMALGELRSFASQVVQERSPVAWHYALHACPWCSEEVSRFLFKKYARRS